MAKIWRWFAPVAVAGGLVAASAAAPAAATTNATISIQAKNPDFPNVTGDTLVFYGVKGFQNAVVSGTVTGAASGDVVTLLAEPFKETQFAPVGKPLTLTSPTQSYSFSVRPTLATKYEAQVTTGSTVDVTSATQPVYVALTQRTPKNGQKIKCNATGCTDTITTRTFVPASAYRTESSKHWYLYLGVNRSSGKPSKRIPEFLTLSKNSGASKARRVSATDFQIVFTFRIAFDGKNIRWWAAACTKDVESKDGIGLPGHHDCGNSKVRSSLTYLG
jgi:hypothetical protein